MNADRPSMRFRVIQIFLIFLACVAHAENGVVKIFAQKLNSSIGACLCTLDPTSHEADNKPVGKVQVKDFHGDEFSVTVLNDEYALKLFQEMTVQKKIPFGFPEDGCFARAHEMSYQLEKMGVLTGKVFATGKFRIDSEKAATGSVTWGFHVAPFFVVDTGKEKQIWVIDPSLFYEPASLQAWLEKLTSNSKSSLSSVFVTNRYIYHPADKERRLRDFDPEDLKKSARLMKRYLKTQTNREKKSTSDL